MNQQCPHCRRRLPIPSSITKPRSQKKYNLNPLLCHYKMQHKHSKIYPYMTYNQMLFLLPLLEEFAKVRSEQHFDLMQFLQEKIKNPELTDDYYPVTQRKKWDLPKKQ